MQQVIEKLHALEHKIDEKIIVSHERFNKHESEEWTMFKEMRTKLSHGDKILEGLLNKVAEAEAKIDSTANQASELFATASKHERYIKTLAISVLALAIGFIIKIVTE